MRVLLTIICATFLVAFSSYQFSFEPIDQTKTLNFFPPIADTSNNPSTEGFELGRMLFYDPILSSDSTFSCASCHRQEVAFSDAPNQFSKGIKGEKLTRNTTPLYNLAWYQAMFWDGRAKTIEEQAFHPVRAINEMALNWKDAEFRINRHAIYPELFFNAFGNQKIDSHLITKAIGQFERSLISNNSKYDQVLRGERYLTPDEYKGFELMNDQTKGDCLHCHTTDANALGTTGTFSNNGLDKAVVLDDYVDRGQASITGKIDDLGKFKIPSLRNVAVTPPYMHDGRFKTLEEVLDFYSEEVNNSLNVDSKMTSAHRGGVHLTEQEKKQIILFLHTLTDSTFLTNPAFSNPF